MDKQQPNRVLDELQTLATQSGLVLTAAGPNRDRQVFSLRDSAGRLIAASPYPNNIRIAISAYDAGRLSWSIDAERDNEGTDRDSDGAK